MKLNAKLQLKTVPPATVSSLPGQIRAQYLTWLRCFPGEGATMDIMVIGGFVTALVLMLVVAHGMFYLAAVYLFAAVRALHKRFAGVQRHFRNGCLCPGKVVSVEPYLVAVYTDMRCGKDSWPVVKIVKQPLQRSRGPRKQIGDRVPTVALYHGKYQKLHWNDFSPIAVCCVTDDPREVATAIERIGSDTDDGWRKLDRFLEQAPTPFEPGLHWMPVPEKPKNPFTAALADCPNRDAAALFVSGVVPCPK